MLSLKASYISFVNSLLKGERIYKKKGIRPDINIKDNTLA
jgi:hypothetical protein